MVKDFGRLLPGMSAPWADRRQALLDGAHPEGGAILVPPGRMGNIRA